MFFKLLSHIGMVVTVIGSYEAHAHISHHKYKKHGVAPSQPVTKNLTLREAMRLAQTTHPEVIALKSAKDAALYRVDQAKALRLPTLDIRAGAGKEYLKQKFSTNKLNPGPVEGSVNETRADPTLSLRQPLFDGFESSSQITKAEKETLQADLKTAESQELIAFKAGDHYIAVRRFSRLLKLAQMNLEAHRNISAKIETLIRAGKASSVDRETALARTEDAEAAVRDIEGDYHTAIAHFIDIVGVEPLNLTNAEIPAHLLPKSTEEGLRLAAANNRSLILAKATKDVAKSDIDVAQSSLWPKVGLEVDGSKRYHTGGKPGTEDNVTALVVVKFNLFNGGRDLARTKELRARAQQAHHTMLREKRNAEREVRISVSERNSAYRQAQALRQAVKAKKDVVDSYKAQFEAGKRSHLDILDAQHEYFLSEGSKITAEATYDLSNLRYLASLGLLTSTFVR